MAEGSRSKWAFRLDKSCAVGGALVPAATIAGNVAFESIIALVGLAWIVRGIIAKENPLRPILKHPLAIPWIVWFLTIMLSLALNGPGGKGWGHDIAFIRYVLFGLALLDISQRLPVHKYLLWGLVGGVLWGLVNTISAYVFGHDLLGKPLIRYAKKLKECGRIAGLAGYVAPFFLAWAISDRKLSIMKRVVMIVIAHVALVLLFRSHVRIMIIGSLMGMAFFFMYFAKRRIRILIISGAVVLTVACGAFLMDRGFVNLNSFYDRVYYWKVVWAMCLENPLFGVGVSSFQDAYTEMAASGRILPFEAPNGKIYELKTVMHAHNIVLMLASCTGLFGLGAFCWLFARALRLIYKEPAEWRVGLITWPVIFIVIGLTGWNIFGNWYQVLFAYFLVLAGTSFYSQKEQEKQRLSKPVLWCGDHRIR